MADTARAEAAAIDAAFARGEDRGPLMGIPIGVKDIIAIAGQLTQCGSAVPMPVATRPTRPPSRVCGRQALSSSVAFRPTNLQLSGPTRHFPFPPPRTLVA